jgi:hypothetical protein
MGKYITKVIRHIKKMRKEHPDWPHWKHAEAMKPRRKDPPEYILKQNADSK